MAKKTKKAKIPKPFGSRIPRKTFEKKIVKYLFVREQKAFISEKYKLKNDEYLFQGIKTKKEFKQFKAIAKSVKTNRGFIKAGKLGAFVAVFGTILLFYLVFLSPIVERSAEKMLENVFSAKVDFDKLRFNPLGGKISFSGLTVADQNNEFKNLFELGYSEININTSALISKKFVIENISAGDLAIGTERSSSGFLPKHEKEEIEEAKDASADKMNNFLSALKMDTMAIIEREAGNLRSLNIVKDIPQEYDEKISKYNDLIEKGQSDYEKIKKAASDVSSINVRNLKATDVPRIVKLVNEIDDDIKTTSGMIKQYKSAVSELNADIKKLSSYISSVNSNIRHDINYLSGFFDLSGGQLKNLGSDIVKAQFSRYLGNSYILVNRLLEYADKVSLAGGDKKGEKGEIRSKGVKVYFPAQKYPSFWLQKSHFNMADDTFSVDLADISSDPDMIDAPAVFATSAGKGKIRVNASGKLDMRKDSKTRFNLEISSSGFSGDLSDSLGSLEIDKFDSDLAVSGTAALGSNGSFSGKTKIVLSNIESSIIENPSMLGKILKDILKDTKTISISANFTVSKEKGTRLSLSTNLDSIMSRALTGMMNDLKDDAREKIGKYLKEQTGADLAVLEEYKDKLGDPLSGCKSTLSGLDEYNSKFEAKKDELEKKKKKLENTATDAVKKIIPKKLPF